MMDALATTIAAAVLTAFLSLLLKPFQDRPPWAGALRELRLYALLFLGISGLFLAVGWWLSSTSRTSDQIASVLSIERQIVWLRSFSSPILKLNAWIEVGLLVLTAAIALIGSTILSAALTKGFSVYKKAARVTFVALFVVSSFSFFQSELAGSSGAIIAQLKRRSDSLANLNRQRAQAVEIAVRNRLAEEIAQSFHDVYQTILDTAEERDTWYVQSQHLARAMRSGGGDPPAAPGPTRPGPDGPSGPGPDRGGSPLAERAAAIEADTKAIRAGTELNARISQLAETHRPPPQTSVTAASVRESYSLPPEADFSERSAERLFGAATALTTDSTAKPPAGAAGEVHAAVRKSLEAGYSATVEQQLRQLIGLSGDSVASELVKLALDPVVLKPFRDFVVQASERVVARALGGEKIEAIIEDFVARSATKRDAIRAALAIRLQQVTLLAKQARDRVRENVKAYWVGLNPELQQRAAEVAAEIVSPGQRLPLQFKGGPLGGALEKTLGAMVAKIGTENQLRDRLETLIKLSGTVAGLSAEPVAAFTELQKLETQMLASQELTVALRVAARQTLDANRWTRWGEVRKTVTEAIAKKQLNLSPQQIAGWDRIWRRWLKEEEAVARTVALETRQLSQPQSPFDAAFSKLLKRDGELAAIWGFAAKSFISKDAEEEFYRRQILLYDTPAKVKRADPNFILYYSVLQPAIEQGRAKDLNEASARLRAGRLDDLIDTKKIDEVIRERGMIPFFGLEHYLVSSKTGTREEAERINGSKEFDRAVSEYCKRAS